MNMNVSDHKILTMKDIDVFGIRLHFNTAANVFINALASFLVLKYSTKAMGSYKYFILMSILGPFIMDFHSSTIFGIYTLFPLPLVCSAGLMKNSGWFWGASFVHIAFGIGGISVLYGLIYQYCSINGNSEIFNKPKNIIFMFASMIIYPLPSMLAWIWNVNWEEGRVNLEQNAPYAYNLYFQGSCVLNSINYKAFIYFLVILFQIMFIYTIAIILDILIMRKLNELKGSMSENSLKARKQFLRILMIQLAVPGIFLVLPVTGLIVGIVFELGSIGELSNWIFQFFGLHSCGNALTVIVCVKPYRQALFKWVKFLKRVICRQKRVISVPNNLLTQASTTATSFAVPK